MIFCGIMQTESVHLHEENNLDQTYMIDLTMAKHEPKFYVHSLNDEKWFWEFRYTSKTDYERVKMCIMDVADNCSTFAETLDMLSEVFMEYFDDMLRPEEHVCQCGNANCSDKLN